MGYTSRFGFYTFGGSQGGDISDEGFRFSVRDRQLIDNVLTALESHEHTGGVALADPVGPLLITLNADPEGDLPAGTDLFYRVSFIDRYGLETAASEEYMIRTPDPIVEPGTPAATASAAAGTLAAGEYLYAVSAHDADGVETMTGPPTSVVVLGGGVAQNTVTLDMPALPAGATGFNVYRKAPTDAQLYWVGATATDEFVDAGAVASATRPVPVVNGTGESNIVTIEAPDVVGGVLPVGVKAWRIYRAYESGGYSDASLVHEVTERVDEVDPDSALLTTWDDVGEPLSDGTPLEMSTTLKPSKLLAGGGGGGSISWRGLWDVGAEYAIDDLVTWMGSTWRAIAGSTGVAPTEGATWTVAAAKGDPGPVGPAGLTWRGAWDPATAYDPNDSVAWGGTTYFALDPAPAVNTPPTGTPADPGTDDLALNAGWAVLALQGAQGPQGEPGQDGGGGEDASGWADTLTERLGIEGRRGGPFVWLPGRYYSANLHNTQTSMAAVANRLLLFPWYLPEAYPIDRLAFNVSTAGTAADVGRAGIWAADPANDWLPGALLIDGGAHAVDTTGAKESVLPDPTTIEGFLWLGFTAPSGSMTAFSTSMLANVTGGSSPSNVSATICVGTDGVQAANPLPDFVTNPVSFSPGMSSTVVAVTVRAA